MWVKSIQILGYNGARTVTVSVLLKFSFSREDHKNLLSNVKAKRKIVPDFCGSLIEYMNFSKITSYLFTFICEIPKHRGLGSKKKKKYILRLNNLLENRALMRHVKLSY